MKPTLYPNGFPSAYEELKTFYPVFYRDVFEMDAIWQTCGGGLDQIEDDVDQVAGSTYVSLMNETALSQMEAFLRVPSDPSRTLEERRKLVSSYFLGTGHFGANEIKEITRAFTEGHCEVLFQNSEVYIHIKSEITDTPPTDDFFFSLRKKVPGHLGVRTEIEIEFNQNLYVGANAMQNDRYSVNPEKLKELSAAGQIYTGAAAMQSDRYTIQPRPQLGLSFKTELFSAMAIMASARTAIQPIAPELLSATTVARTGCGIVENTHYTVRTQGGI